MKRRGKKSLSSEPALFEVERQSNIWGFVRKLGDIYQNLALPVEQGEVIGFLTNPKNAQRVNGLVEDIHEALMDYKVYILNCQIPALSEIYIRLHCNRIFTVEVVSSL